MAATRSSGNSATRLGELVEARRPVADEVLVVQLLLDDDVEPAQAHGGVGADLERQPEVGTLGALAAPRIEDDQLRAALLRLADGVVDRRPAVPLGIVPEQHDAVRVARKSPSGNQP